MGHVAPAHFDSALSRLDHLTEHYRPGLVLPRALLFGLAPSDIFAESGSRAAPLLEFSLPTIFEDFLERLVTEAAMDDPTLSIRSQVPDRSAFLDGFGNPYSEVRPDLALIRRGRPRAVLDAKFKPSYLATEPGQNRRVSNADMYQLLFYQALLAREAGSSTIPAAIMAPQFGSTVPVPEARTIAWTNGAETHVVNVIALPLPAVTSVIAAGGTGSEALAAAPELSAFLEHNWLGFVRPT